MAIGKFLEPYGGVNAIFDPVPSYSGDWIFTLENLFKNAKSENGINLFQTFYEKTYAKPLEAIFKTPRILDFRVGMISKPNENNIGRCLRYSKVDFFVELTNYLNMHIDTDNMSPEEKNNYFRSLISNIKKDNDTLNQVYAEALKAKMRKLKDVLENEINSEYYEIAMRDYEHYKDKMNFHAFINTFLNITSQFHYGMLRLGDFFDKNIDYHELAKCFDDDTFYLLFAKIIYEFNLIREQESGYLDNSYGYLMLYQKAISELIKEDKKYNPKILFTLSSGKKKKISRWDFQIEWQSLLEKHPEAQSIKLPIIESGNEIKYKDIGLMQKISKLYQEEARVNWQFLPKGEGIKRGSIERRQESSSDKDKTLELVIKETNMRIAILENSGFIGTPVRGLDTFTGYFAFIYPNGKVILEKFWENEEKTIPTQNCATYVMNIDNFIELSKLSKTILIEYMKTLPEIGVKRIFHTSINNWQRNLYQEINGTYRLEDAIDFINSLRSGELKNEP